MQYKRFSVLARRIINNCWLFIVRTIRWFKTNIKRLSHLYVTLTHAHLCGDYNVPKAADLFHAFIVKSVHRFRMSINETRKYNKKVFPILNYVMLSAHMSHTTGNYSALQSKSTFCVEYMGCRTKSIENNRILLTHVIRIEHHVIFHIENR